MLNYFLCRLLVFALTSKEKKPVILHMGGYNLNIHAQCNAPPPQLM